MKTTQAGLDRLNENIAELSRRHNESAEEARQALADQGPEENEAYYHARSRCQQLETQILSLTKELRSVDIVNEITFTGTVDFGTFVNLLNLDTEKEVAYTILGEHEASAKRSILSYTSPIGAGLVGHRVGDTVDIDMPNGRTISFEILSVEPSTHVKSKTSDTTSEV